MEQIANWTNLEPNKNESLLNQSNLRCQPVHPHDYPGFEWIPAEIEVAGRSTYSFITVYMSFLLVSSIFLNGVVIVATYKYQVLRQSFNYGIVNLAVADLLSGIFGCTIGVIVSAEGYFYLGEKACYVQGWGVAVFSLTGVNSIVIIAVERFLIICKPLRLAKIAKKQALSGVAVAWLYSIAWNLALLFLTRGIIVEGFGTHCAPNWFPTSDMERNFLILYLIFCFVIPLSIIIFCYTKVLIVVHKISKERGLSNSIRYETKVVRMVIVMTIAFLVAWLPYAALTICVIINPHLPIKGLIQTIPSLFAKSSLIYNPIIYVGMNRKFRQCVIRMFLGASNTWREHAQQPQYIETNCLKRCAECNVCKELHRKLESSNRS